MTVSLDCIDRFSYVMSHVFTVEMYPFHSFIRISSRFDQSISQSCYAQDAASAGHGFPVRIKSCSGVEAVIAFLAIEIVQAGDHFALLIASRISARSNNYAYCRIVFKFGFNAVQRPVNAGLHDLNDIRLKPGQIRPK